jgi:chemotaxis protein histidine kinase CheA
MSDAVGKMVKTFYDVELNEVSVTQRPANYDAWLVAKSYKDVEEDINTFEKSIQLRQEFLFDNPQLDYMQAFAKSIPDKEWKKVAENDNIINDMSIFKKNETSETTEAKKEGTETTTEKEATTSSETAEKEATTSETTEKDQSETTTEKAVETETTSETMKESTESTTEKAQETTETTSEKKEQSANGGETSEVAEKETTEETMSERMDRLEESQKSMLKMMKDGFQSISKAMEDSTTEVKEATASETDAEKEESETSTKKEATDETTTEKEETDTTTEKEETSEAKPSDYQMDEVSKAISTIASSLKTDSDLDTFVAALSTAIQKSQDTMQESGKSIIGFTQRIVDMVKESPEFQEEIRKMVKQPGMRKSVLVGGVPYMVSKDGKRYALSAKEVGAEEVKKSDKPTSFKELFKAKFSSFEGNSDK